MILDYTSLRAAIANWLARADLSSAIPEFIQLAEARINRSLYVRERETSVTGTSAAGAIPIPADYDRMIALRVPVGGQMRALDAQPVMQDRDGQGVPYSYSVRDSEFRLCGVDDTDYTLTYWARIPPLSDSNPTNWLLVKEPGLYLYGALIEASPYLKNDERTLVWATQFKANLDDCNAGDAFARFGPGTVAKVDFCAP